MVCVKCTIQLRRSFKIYIMEIKTADKFVDTCNNLSGMIEEILSSGSEIPSVIILTVNELMCKLVNFNNHFLKTNKSLAQHNVLNYSGIGSLSHSKKDSYKGVRSSRSGPDSELIGPETRPETAGSPMKHVAKASFPSHPSSSIGLQPSNFKDISDDRSNDKQTEKPPLKTTVFITKVFRTYLKLIVKGLFKSDEVTIYCRVCNLLCLTSWPDHETYVSHIEKASRFDDLIMCFCRLCRLCIYVRREAIVPYFKYHYNKLHSSKSELSWNECLVFVESTDSSINSSESNSVNGLNKIPLDKPSATDVKNDIAPASSSELDNNRSLCLVPNISIVEKPSVLKTNIPDSDYVGSATRINSPTTNPCPKPNDSKKFNSLCSGVKTEMVTPTVLSKSESPIHSSPEHVKTGEKTLEVSLKPDSLINFSPEAIPLLTTNDRTVEVQPVANISLEKSLSKSKKRGGKCSAKAHVSAVTPSDAPEVVTPRADSSRSATESKADKKNPVRKAPVEKNQMDASEVVTPRADSSRSATESKADKKDPVRKAPLEKNQMDAYEVVTPRADSSRSATESKADKKDPVRKAPVEKNQTDALSTTPVNSVPVTLYPNFDKLVNEILDEWKETSIKLDGGYCSVCDLGILSAFEWYSHTEDHKVTEPSKYDEELCPYCTLKLFGSEHQKYFNLPSHINLDKAFGKPRKC